LFAAGDRIDPPMSEPIPRILPLNPINAPSPPDDPPLVSVVLKGFVVTLIFVSTSQTNYKPGMSNPTYPYILLLVSKCIRLCGCVVLT